MATVITQVKDDEFIIDDEVKKDAPTQGGSDESEKEESPRQDTNQTENDDDHDEDEGHEGSEAIPEGSTDEEREAIRERRRQERQERKEYRKQREDTLRREIKMLKDERQQLSERLAIIERRTTGSEIAQIDTAIDEANRVSASLRQQIKLATEANDGEAMALATERFYQVQRRSEDLQRLKRAAVENTRRQENTTATAAADPVLKRNAESWMSKNSWYDPQGLDTDSRVALTIDNTLAEEGYDPRTQEFWDELTARLKVYLPHRYKGQQSNTQRKQPPTTVAGSGRDTSGSGKGYQFKLSPERVAAMKDAGIWDDVEKRNAMIKKYADYDRSQK